MRLFFRILLVLFLVPLALVGRASAQSYEALTEYTLDNGLQVVLAPDRRVPKVVMNLRYRVGSMNEPAGRSGFAHLFEHLMFSGTKNWPNVFGAHSANGNTINAWTSEDGTVYYVEGLSSALPMILSLEADRMANIGGEVDQRELDLQRSVVKNEMRQNVLDQPGGSGWRAFWSAMFPDTHPYSRTVIGSIADLDAATLDDVRGFFNTYYVPNNAILVLIGDLDIEKTKALIEDTFGRIPGGADVPRPQVADVQPTRALIEVEDRVPTNYMIVGFSGPAAIEPENGLLVVAAELLGNAEFGRLRQTLVNEKRVATYIDASWNYGLLGGRFAIDAVAAEGVSMETLEAEFRAAIEAARDMPITQADLDRARRTALLSDRKWVEPFENRASQVSYHADILLNAGSALMDDPVIAGATIEQVENAMKSLLDLDEVSVLKIRPGERGGYPAVLSESSGIPEPFTAPDRAGVDIPVLEAEAPRAAELPAREERKLANGATLVHFRMADAPISYVAAVATGGWTSQPQGKEGLFELAARMAYRGAGDMDYVTFAKAAKDIGADINYKAGELATAIFLSVPSEEFAAGTGMMADAITSPRFDETEWSIAVTELTDALARQDQELATVAMKAAFNELFPATADRPGPFMTTESIRSISLDEAKAAFKRLFQPRSTVFQSVGSLTADEVAAALDEAFVGWSDSEPGYESSPYPSVTFQSGRQVVMVPEPGAQQSALFVARPAPGLVEPNRGEAMAVMRLLGGEFSSRLNSVIREEKGYSYGVQGWLMDPMNEGAGLVIATTVERDNTGPALAEIFRGFDELATRDVMEAELNRTRTTYRVGLAGTAETSERLFEHVLSLATGGVDFDDAENRRERMTMLELPAVQEQARAMSSLEPSVVIVAGDPDIVGPQLEALGLGEVATAEVARSADMGESARTADMLGLLSTSNDVGAELPAIESRLGREAGSTLGVHCHAGTVCDEATVEAGNPPAE